MWIVMCLENQPKGRLPTITWHILMRILAEVTILNTVWEEPSGSTETNVEG